MTWKEKKCAFGSSPLCSQPSYHRYALEINESLLILPLDACDGSRLGASGQLLPSLFDSLEEVITLVVVGLDVHLGLPGLTQVLPIY